MTHEDMTDEELVAVITAFDAWALALGVGQRWMTLEPGRGARFRVIFADGRSIDHAISVEHVARIAISPEECGRHLAMRDVAALEAHGGSPQEEPKV
jgi:hypothetical protein